MDRKERENYRIALLSEELASAFFSIFFKFTVWNSVQQSRGDSFNAHARWLPFTHILKTDPPRSEIPLKQQHVQWEKKSKRK